VFVVTRKRRTLLTLVAIVALMTLAALVLSGPKEPTYCGKSLTAWLMSYRTPIGAMAPTVSQEAANAIRHIGTNGLPCLLHWVQEDPTLPPWKQKIFDVVYRWKLGDPDREFLLRSLAERQLRAGYAIWGFVILGEAARSAIPDLVRVANEGSPMCANGAACALGYLGKDAVAPLLSLITNAASPGRHQALTSLGQMRYVGTKVHPGIVLLIQYLKDPELGPGAADILGRLHLEGDISVPALTECMQSTNQRLRFWGAIGLGRFGPDARPALPGLIKMLEDPELEVRTEATNALQIISPETLAKKPD
jgi:hypothetical protein